MARSSEELVQFIAEFARRDLPSTLASAAGLRLMDTLGCALYGGGQEWTQILLKTSSHARGQSTAFGGSAPLSADIAALCNGTAAHGFELDDLLMEALAHPGAVIVPAALAVAEEEGSKGIDLLKAIVAGYEVMGRLGRALGPEASGRGWHLTGVAGPAAAATAVGVLLGFDAATLSNAIGIACASAGGNKSFTGTGGMVKRLHAGLAARAGVTAARLAQGGFTGPSGALDGQFGLLDVVAGASKRPQKLNAGLGESFEIDHTTIKVYPCCAVLQSTLEGILKLRREHGFEAADVKTLKVASSQRAVTQNNERNPADLMAAQYSLPFCAAVALRSDPVDPRLFSNDALVDPALHGLIAKVDLRIDDEMTTVYPRSMGAVVTAILSDGRAVTESIVDARGSARAPCSDAELTSKFRRLAGLSIGDVAAEGVLTSIAALKRGGSVRALSESLRRTPAYA